MSEETMADERRVYELAYLLAPSLDESGRSSAVDAIRATVEKQGSIINETYPELLDLAYPMDYLVASKRTSVTTAYFGWMYFEAEPEATHTIKEAMDHDSNLVRYLMTQTTKEAAMMPTNYTFGKGTSFEASDDESDEKADEDKNKEEEPQEIVEEEVDKAIDDLIGDEESKEEESSEKDASDEEESKV